MVLPPLSICLVRHTNVTRSPRYEAPAWQTAKTRDGRKKKATPTKKLEGKNDNLSSSPLTRRCRISPNCRIDLIWSGALRNSLFILKASFSHHPTTAKVKKQIVPQRSLLLNFSGVRTKLERGLSTNISSLIRRYFFSLRLPLLHPLRRIVSQNCVV